ncbi:MAG: DUF1592 domain-containing protein [Myxococcota bacterium]
MLGVFALAACTGEFGTPGATTLPSEERPREAPETFACDPTQVPEALTLRRLTRDQLLRSIDDIMAELAPASVTSVRSALTSTAARIPDDLATDALDYRRMSQDVGQAHVDGYYEVARRVARAVTDDPERLADALGDCATDGDPANDESCVQGFLTRFGRLAFRRPLSQAEIDHYAPPIDIAAPAFSDRVRHLITALLMAPNFVYLLELGGEEVSANTYEIDAFELASRLSFHFWQTGPDEALLQAAESGELLTDAGYEAEVDRLYADPRSQETLALFFEDWLRLHEVPEMDAAVGRADFQAYAGADLPGPALRQEMIDDVLALTRHVVESNGTVAELFTTRLSFAPSQAVADLYGGAPLYTPGSPPAELPAGPRSGLLSRPALLANNQATTRPILRGALIRQRVLCDELELPENMDDVNLGGEVGQSTREQVEALTESPGTVCAGCHALLNPLGFAFEEYDALGRFRQSEQVFDEAGELVAEYPVNSETQVTISFGEEGFVRNGAELSALIAESAKTEACFARQYFRFAFGRHEHLDRDSCTLEAMRTVLAEGGSIQDLFRQVAEQPEFRLVRKEAAQ